MNLLNLVPKWTRFDRFAGLRKFVMTESQVLDCHGIVMETAQFLRHLRVTFGAFVTCNDKNICNLQVTDPENLKCPIPAMEYGGVFDLRYGAPV